MGASRKGAKQLTFIHSRLRRADQTSADVKFFCTSVTPAKAGWVESMPVSRTAITAPSPVNGEVASPTALTPQGWGAGGRLRLAVLDDRIDQPHRHRRSDGDNIRFIGQCFDLVLTNVFDFY